MNNRFFFSLLSLSFLLCNCTTTLPTGTECDDLYFSSIDKQALKPQYTKTKVQQGVFMNQYPNLTWTATTKSVLTQRVTKFKGSPSQVREAGVILSDTLKGYSTNESFQVEMTFNDTDVLLKDVLSINGLEKFNENHILNLSEFDDLKMSYPEWFIPTYTSSATISINDQMQVSGKGCLKLQGFDDNRDGNIISVTKYFANMWGGNSSAKARLKSNPANTWIFLYVYGSGDSSQVLKIQAIEANQSFRQEYFKYEIPLGFTGWKQFAIRYSDLQLTDPNWLPVDYPEDLRNPRELLSLQLVLGTYVPGSTATVQLDNVMVLFN
jgi:hypothetical protein